MQIDFTSTAVCRPAILERTFQTFKNNLLGIDLSKQTLHINIDRVPIDQYSDVYFVAAKFFATVYANIPAVPNFAAAVRWAWSQPKTEYFFHLEDDWELMRAVDLTAMKKMLDDDAGLSTVNLRAYHFHDDRICLSPGLFRASHCKAMALRMVSTVNPERQLRPVQADFPQGGKHGNFRGIHYPEAQVLKDIGREWLDGSGWKKQREITLPMYWNNWEKANAND